MEIAGAIFDCDGTLVDSMGMWAHAWDWLAERHGKDPVPLSRIESLSLRDTCSYFHDELGIPDSTDELYEELCAHVRDAYEHEVALMPGAREFLDELASAGVPMVLASSTPVRELRCCLDVHGLSRYFADVVSTEDVGGRDKEFPDVYLEAARRLGAPREATWVFEDAPFGVRTARRAGFAVVGLINDHDGRREEDVRPFCDVFVHGFAELSVPLLRDYERPVPVHGAPLAALVVAGSPEPSSPGLLAVLADEADYVICADGGADACRAAGVAPDVFCGDSDSASSEAAAWARAAARTCVGFPSEKYATDLSLALDCARHEASRQARPLAITLTCASGGRPDHALAVVGLLAGSGAARARIVEDAYEMRIVSAAGESRWYLGPDAPGATFSAVAVAPDTRIDERGMRWELDDHPMGLLDDLGISNVVTTPDAEVACRAGAVAAFLLRATKTPQ
ncbi:thiamine diphosphokinase [Thermophilibacter sp. ET337]|uniref:thiamine diphosphokinase n=1 Tax=Thermophilibacter sp. ET337 TaxID=2973084 RepID=UPI0021AC8D20|nr:thiamine diphosphokinase [Thermophilibacter sp. ET337]MCR8907558.1 thiamine diphosphokinase [Thermophilibacter sp. ET337]